MTQNKFQQGDKIQGSETDIKARELEKRVLELRKTGLTYRQIADRLDRSVSGVHHACMRALERVHDELLESGKEALALEVERLDSLYQRAMNRVMQGDLDAIAKALKIIKQRARLLGLDDVTVSHEISATEEEREEKIKEILGEKALDV